MHVSINHITYLTSVLSSVPQNEVREARYLADRQERLHHLHHTILDMDKKTMTEIRRYHKPPAGVHQVMRASLLIMGEDEESTMVRYFICAL